MDISLRSRKAREGFRETLLRNFGEELSEMVHFVALGETAPPDGIVVHEDLWQSKRDIILSRLASHAGVNRRIHGRLTRLAVPERKAAELFFRENHLFGAVKAHRTFGLEYKGEMVAAAAFGRPCPAEREEQTLDSVELVRYCTARGCNVIGGLDKLLKHFASLERPSDIMTSVDLEWGQGEAFRKLGFREIGRTAPVVFLVDKENYRRLFPGEFTPEMREALHAPQSGQQLTAMGLVAVSNRGNVRLAKW